MFVVLFFAKAPQIAVEDNCNIYLVVVVPKEKLIFIQDTAVA